MNRSTTSLGRLTDTAVEGGMREIKGSGHLVLHVRDLAVSADFYRDVLRWQPIIEGSNVDGSALIAAVNSPLVARTTNCC